MLVREFIAKGTQILNRHNVHSPRQDLEALLCDICHMNRVSLLTQKNQSLNADDYDKLHRAIKRRISGSLLLIF